MSATVYEITHSGEGVRGRSVEVMGYGSSPERYATEASEYFDDADMKHGGYRPDVLARFDGTYRVVEVAMDWQDMPPMRFRVRCRVGRTYEAEGLSLELLLRELFHMPQGSAFVRCDVYASLEEKHRNIKLFCGFEPSSLLVCTLDSGLVRDANGDLFGSSSPIGLTVARGWAACRIIEQRGASRYYIEFNAFGGFVHAEVPSDDLVIKSTRCNL